MIVIAKMSIDILTIMSTARSTLNFFDEKITFDKRVIALILNKHHIECDTMKIDNIIGFTFFNIENVNFCMGMLSSHVSKPSIWKNLSRNLKAVL